MKKRYLAMMLAMMVTTSAVMSGVSPEMIYAAEVQQLTEEQQLTDDQQLTVEQETGQTEELGDETAAVSETANRAENIEVSENTESVENTQEAVLPTGLIEPEIMTIDVVEEEQVYDATELMCEEDLNASAIYANDWDKYSSNYFYNQLSAEEKQVWDALDALCLRYLTGTEDIRSTIYKGATYYVTDFVNCGSVNGNKIIKMFRYSNPQYYFLDTAIWSSSRGNYRAMGVYSKFANGAARATETANVKAQAEAWVSMAAGYATDEQKVKAIHDAIVNKVDYNHDIYSATFDDDVALSQTAYSTLCMDKTVCAGYAQALQMICNAAGVDAISVTSKDHQWNKVRINDSWYNVDATWADQTVNGYVLYYYFERNDAVYDGDEATYAASHAEESYWNEYLPACTLDSGSTDLVAGTTPVITQTTATPQISVVVANGTNNITISSATPGAIIYYTTDGTEPSASYTKATKYTGTFSTKSAVTVNAVAVCNGQWDSGIASAQTEEQIEIAYTVKFNGNGSTSGSMTSQSFTYGTGKALKTNKFKKTGYTFTGWNTKKNGKGTSYANKADGSMITTTNGKTVTLYAQWERTKYTITYKLNGGKNNSKNPTTYTKVTKTIKLKNPTRKGYTFKGWYTDAKFKNKITQIKKGSSGKKTLYAKWQKNTYKITYNLNGGKNSSKNPKSYTVTTKTIKLKNPTKKGYTFKGWYTDAKYKNKVTQIKKGSTGSIKLYAKWKKK